MAIENMAINAIVAGGDLAIREPFPAVVGDAVLERLLGQLDGGRELLMPVKVLGLVPPEVIWVFERVPQHLVLDVVIVFRHGDCFGGCRL